MRAVKTLQTFWNVVNKKGIPLLFYLESHEELESATGFRVWEVRKMLVLCRISESGLNVVLKDGEIEFISDAELGDSGNTPVTVADGMRVVFSVDEKFYIVAVRGNEARVYLSDARYINDSRVKEVYAYDGEKFSRTERAEVESPFRYKFKPIEVKSSDYRDGKTVYKVGVYKIAVESEEVKETGSKVSLFDDETEGSDALGDIPRKYSEYKSDCKLCHGTGTVINKLGYVVECSCGKALFEERERLRELAEKKPVFSVPKSVSEIAVLKGLVPKEHEDIVYDSEYVYRRITGSIGGDRVVGFENYDKAVCSIINACRTGTKVRHSYLLAADTGFGKKSFVYTCLKYLLGRDVRVPKYLSLSEIGFLSEKRVKQAKALNVPTYYFRYNESDKFRFIWAEVSKKAEKRLLEILAERSAGVGISLSEKEFSDLKHEVDYAVLEEVTGLYNEAIKGYDRNDTEGIAAKVNEVLAKQLDTYEDILNAPILFTYFAEYTNIQYEVEVLHTLLTIRGNKCLPTIVLMEDSVRKFGNIVGYSNGVDGDIEVDAIRALSDHWGSMLSENSTFFMENLNAKKVAEDMAGESDYKRMIYVNCYKTRDYLKALVGSRKKRRGKA